MSIYKRIEAAGCVGCIFNNPGGCDRPGSVKDELGGCSGGIGADGFQYVLDHTSSELKNADSGPEIRYERILGEGCGGCVFDNIGSCVRPRKIRELLGSCAENGESYHYRIVEDKDKSSSLDKLLTFKSEKKFTF